MRAVCSLSRSNEGQVERPKNLLEDMPLCLDVRKGEFDFSVNATRSNESRVQRLYPVCCHNYFDISTGIKPIELIEKLQHRPLYFTFPARR